jgi:hypothetical protein
LKRKIYLVPLALILLPVLLAGLHYAVQRRVCYREQLLNEEDPAGFKFEVEDETCDIIAHDEGVFVYATSLWKDEPLSSLNWLRPRTLLFHYTPTQSNLPPPSVIYSSPSIILISVPAVDTVLYQRREWKGISVNYDVGHGDGPSTPR